ncbi:MAG: hemolysin family protein [Candidatus Latescibacterota bacterium]|jgi:CBS domain containing-hemolysin-like protein
MGAELDFILYILALLLLGVYSGAYVALEILSLSTSERTGEDDDDDAGHSDAVEEDPVRNGIALNIARTLAVIFVVVTSVRLAHLHMFGVVGNALWYTVAFAFLSIVVPAFVARAVAARNPDRFAAAVRVLTRPVTVILGPVAGAVGSIARSISPGYARYLGFRVIPLRQKIEEFGVQNGEPPDAEQRLMESILDFGETRVREVMVPRVDIVAVNSEMDVNEAAEVIMEAGHSRVPVYNETIDKIVGTIYTKDLLQKIVDGEEFSMSGIARDAFFVPESKMIDELLTEFKLRKQHLAIVVDEYGGTAGIVTLEDVLEEIVGDIQDEFDSEEKLVQKLDDDTAICNAKINLDELSEELGIDFPDEGPNSLGGLLYQMIGRVPRVGDKRVLNGVELEIESIERQRIDKVIIRGLSSAGDRSRNGSG